MKSVELRFLRALILDDHALVRKQMDRMLRDLKLTHIDQASTADEAAAKLSAGRYDVVFIDWHMPGKSGVALMEECREDRAYDAVAFVIVSAESEERFVSEAIKAGATAYVVKPVTESALQVTVRRVTGWLEKRSGKPESGDAHLK